MYIYIELPRHNLLLKYNKANLFLICSGMTDRNFIPHYKSEPRHFGEKKIGDIQSIIFSRRIGICSKYKWLLIVMITQQFPRISKKKWFLHGRYALIYTSKPGSTIDMSRYLVFAQSYQLFSHFFQIRHKLQY